MLELKKDHSENLSVFQLTNQRSCLKTFSAKERSLFKTKTVVDGGRFCLVVSLYYTKKG
jgi:hypothetical protein